MAVFGVQILSISPSDLKMQKPARLEDECVGTGAAIHIITGSCSNWLPLVSGELTKSAELVCRLLPLLPH